MHGTLLGALGFREGGIWVVACLPLAAAGLVAELTGNLRIKPALVPAKAVV